MVNFLFIIWASFAIVNYCQLIIILTSWHQYLDNCHQINSLCVDQTWCLVSFQCIKLIVMNLIYNCFVSKEACIFVSYSWYKTLYNCEGYWSYNRINSMHVKASKLASTWYMGRNHKWMIVGTYHYEFLQ